MLSCLFSFKLRFLCKKNIYHNMCGIFTVFWEIHYFWMKGQMKTYYTNLEVASEIGFLF